MGEGPELGADPPPPPEPPPPSDAARIIDQITRTRVTIFRTIVVATSLILIALWYMRCTDPYWRCKRLWDANETPGSGEGWSEEEDRMWNELGCEEWPGVQTVPASPLSR